MTQSVYVCICTISLLATVLGGYAKAERVLHRWVSDGSEPRIVESVSRGLDCVRRDGSMGVHTRYSWNSVSTGYWVKFPESKPNRYVIVHAQDESIFLRSKPIVCE